MSVDPRGEDEQLPRDVGPYRVERLIGRGGMGAVYRAWDQRLERRVAIKRLRPDARSSVQGRARLLREARAAASLAHSAIVQIFDVVETTAEIWIVMELIEGETLARLVRERPPPLATRLELARQIAEGLAAAHRGGVIHRDLKTENVMVTPEGQAKILDFGLARRTRVETAGDTVTQTGKLVGTYRAMAPEQISQRPVDARADLFAFGVMLYELVTGVSPFLAPSAAETLARVCTHQQTPVDELEPELPPPLSALVDRLLEKDPQRRPRRTSSVAAELASILTSHASASAAVAVSASVLDAPTEAWIDGQPTLDPIGGVETTPTMAALASRAEGPPGARWRRAVLAFTALLLLALVLVALVGRYSPSPSPPSSLPSPSIHVAVPRPQVDGGDDREGIDLLATAVRTALLRGLTGLEGVAVLDPAQVDALDDAEPLAIARALAADELLTSRLDCARERCQVALTRLAGDAGTVIWTDVFPVLPERLLLVGETVEAGLRRAYADRRSSSTAPAVAAEVWERFLRLRQLYEQRPEEIALDDLIARAAMLREEAPELIEARVLEATLRLQRFRDRREVEDVQVAFELLEGARALAPDNLRPLTLQVDVALAGDRLERAEEALEELRRLRPGSAEVLTLEARVLERRGRPREALDTLRAAVRINPAWTRLYRLADLEYRLGEVVSARAHLDQVLARHPENYYARSLLAQLELLSGDPRRAVELYDALIARGPVFAVLTNRGVAQLLLEDYEEAAASFRAALELAPENPLATLNLADARLLAGEVAEAMALYRLTVEQAAGDPAAGQWQMRSVSAQALAHLGEDDAARAALDDALALAPDNPQAAYEAAVVLVLLGDREGALEHALAALDGGVEPRWLELPWLAPLRETPALVERLASSQ